MRKKLDSSIVYGTALTCFAKYGYKKTTLEDIAAELGMTNSNLYSYATSKQALYYDSISWGIDQWQESVRQKVAGIEDPEQELLTAFQAAVTYIEEHDVMKQILQNDPAIFPMFPEVDPIEEFNNWAMNFIRDILKHGMENGTFNTFDLDDTTLVVFNLYKFFIISAYTENTSGSMDIGVLKNTVYSILMNGLLK